MNNSRRNLARLLGVAGAGIVAWKKPVVTGVALPAHASTSSCLDCRVSANDENLGIQIVLFEGSSQAGANYEFANDPTCSGQGVGQVFLVIADSQEEAEFVWENTPEIGGACPGQLTRVETISGGEIFADCNFWACVPS